MFRILMPVCSYHVQCSMYLCLSAHASIMFQICGSSFRGSPEKGQKGRVEQPACVGSSLHMALGILCFTRHMVRDCQAHAYARSVFLDSVFQHGFCIMCEATSDLLCML